LGWKCFHYLALAVDFVNRWVGSTTIYLKPELDVKFSLIYYALIHNVRQINIANSE
jgi:hypothetical protein